MTLFDWIDFVRVAGAFILLFGALPLAARRMGDRARHSLHCDLAQSFVYASIFFQTTALLLGNWRLCYSGLMMIVVVCWLAATVAFASKRRWIWDANAWRAGVLRVLEWFETKSWRPLVKRARTRREVISLPNSAAMLAAWFGVVFLSSAAFAIGNVRFLGSQTYERALSLQLLVNGRMWQQDGSVALLAPIAHFSGADGATVVRLTGPLFLLLLVLAGAYCAWAHTKRLSAVYLASLLLGLYPIMVGYDSRGELAGPEIAAAYWMLALALARHQWRYAIAAAATAFLVHGQFTPVLAGVLLCVSAAIVFSALIDFVPRIVTSSATAVAVLFGASILLGMEPPEDGPYQYESAARTVLRIAREHPRNKWMIISPAQELASTYGRGWHLQIYDFVRDHTPEAVADPAFRFRYPVDDIFVFIEKEPLRQLARGPAMAADDYSFRYFTQTGRSSLQFLGAQIMAAYCSSHDDAKPYFEDEQLVVYRIPQSQPAVTPGGASSPLRDPDRP